MINFMKLDFISGKQLTWFIILDVDYKTKQFGTSEPFHQFPFSMMKVMVHQMQSSIIPLDFSNTL